MLDYGTLVISLDFEMMWGMHDVATKSGYGMTNVQYVPLVIDKLLTLFDKYGVHATFATVGMIMYENKDDLLKDIPNNHPTYNNPVCSPYNNVIWNIEKSEESLFFQKTIVDKLKNAVGIEIATHTYCHYYCWEKGQTLDQFETDLKKAIEVANRNEITIRSIVFPRNNVSENHLAICAKYGINSYRGNAKQFYKEPMNQPKQRLCRLLDTYVPLAGDTTIPYSAIQQTCGMFNLQASRLLRPYSRSLAFLDNIRMKRIKREIINAAINKEMYHLWWHPHNFGDCICENISFLEKLLICYTECHKKYGMQSLTMNELSNVLSLNNNSQSI